MNKTYSLYEAKAKLSEIVREVRERGTTATITYHGKPVAEIHPVEDELKLDPRIAQMVREGLVIAPTKKFNLKEFRALPRGNDPEGAVRKAVQEDREESW